MTKITTYTTTGTKDVEIELPLIFSTPFRRELIHKAYTNLTSHKFQPQGRHPSAGQDVVADSNDPPTGQGVSRVARATGGGGGRQGQGAEVASTRGGRQAHPPIVEKVIYKKLNKKENKLALCSAIAATSSKDLIKSRGHKIEGIESFPIIVTDDIESINKTSEISKVLESLKLSQDMKRLESRKPRSGQSRLRGRSKKVGKSVLFVTKNSENISKAIGALPGIEVKNVKDLSVLDLAPGSDPIRLTVYSKSAIEEIGKIKSTHLELMVKTQ
jgi:large subunit ribosomal protein L4e